MPVSSRRNSTGAYLYNLKVGDMVTVKSEDWYRDMNPLGKSYFAVPCEENPDTKIYFNDRMRDYLSDTRKVLKVYHAGDFSDSTRTYRMDSTRYILEGCTKLDGNPDKLEPDNYWLWSPEMLEL